MIFRPDDQFYMDAALAQAKKAFLANEVPIGAVVIDTQGTIIGRGYNQVEKKQQQAAHAEVLAIQKANKVFNNWRLNHCWLYVTVEPCRMCMGLIRLSRMAGVIYGIDSPLFGYSLDRESEFPVYKENVVKVIKGLRAQEAADLLKQFFKQKRKKNE
jgi:tRNA(adenine34) deaminase